MLEGSHLFPATPCLLRSGPPTPRGNPPSLCHPPALHTLKLSLRQRQHQRSGQLLDRRARGPRTATSLRLLCAHEARSWGEGGAFPNPHLTLPWNSL